ncbi:Spo0E family sporulation regulatory protein-aspartic acid phosphatase [Priestia aryabhattai]|uniref:Spo0E family sporulation regulatory protein-aspartic acid phosphatase n=1 Tax=Priestia megaterium TaxID=1404 RepID=UPI0039B981EB
MTNLLYKNNILLCPTLGSILSEIEDIRELMIATGIREGFDSIQTIVLSQKLDELLNKFHWKREEHRKLMIYYILLNI